MFQSIPSVTERQSVEHGTLRFLKEPIVERNKQIENYHLLLNIIAAAATAKEMPNPHRADVIGHYLFDLCPAGLLQDEQRRAVSSGVL